MNVLRRVWAVVMPLTIDCQEPDRTALVALMAKIETPRVVVPEPVRHQLKVVDVDWWKRTYAPEHKRTA